MGRHTIVRRAGLVVVNLVVFAAAFLVVRSLIDRAAGWEPDGEVAVKLAHLGEHGDDYEVIFIGSSRTFRGVDPAAFDARMAALGADVESFNLGIQGMFAYELEAVLERVLALELPSLKMVVIAPDVFQADLETEIASSARVVAWHGFTETAAAVRRALDQPRTRPNRDVVVGLDALASDVEARRSARRSVLNDIESGFASGRLVRLLGSHETAAPVEIASSRLAGAPPDRIEELVAGVDDLLGQERWVDVSVGFTAERIDDAAAVAEAVAVLDAVAERLGDRSRPVGAPFRVDGNRMVLRLAPPAAVAALEWALEAAVEAGGAVEIPVTAADGTWFAVVSPPEVRSGASDLGERALWVYNHLNAFLINTTNQGRLLEEALGDSKDPGVDPGEVLGAARDGFVPYDLAATLGALGQGTEFRRREFLAGESIRLFTRSRLEPTESEVDYGLRIAAMVEAAGAIPVLAALPGDASSPWVEALAGSVVTLDFNEFPEHAGLFDRSLWFDRGHMNSTGAAVFSSRLAETLHPILLGSG